MSAPLEVGEETLCGDVGRLSLLSNDPDPLNSGIDILLDWLGVVLCCGWLLDPFPAPSFLEGLDGSDRVVGDVEIALRATASLSMAWGGLVLLTADVSIVMVGLPRRLSVRLGG